MDTLEYIIDKYKLEIAKDAQMPFEIPNVGRNNLPELFRELGFTLGAEIGVFNGKFSKVLCDGNPECKLLLVDLWEPYDEYNDSLNSDELKVAYQYAKKRLRGCNVEFVRAKSMKAVNWFEDESLDFVYIDGNHELPWVMDDIVYWSEKVRPGGIVSGHDYIRYTKKKPFQCQVKEATGWYMKLTGIWPWFVLGTKAKTPGMVRDAVRSWMWVKV